MRNKNLLLSIVITSYTMERFKDICDLFDSIKAQTYPNIEIFFVVERSKKLIERAKRYVSGKGMSIRTLFNDGVLGVSAARNLGIKKARGDIIATVDDDVILFPDWAEEMVKTYKDDAVIGVTGPAFTLWEDKSMSWFPEELSWMWGGTLWADRYKAEEIKEIRNVGGMNCSFLKEAFDKGGYFIPLSHYWEKSGWNPFAGDFGWEVEFSLRVRKAMGKKIVFNPKVRVYHKVHKFRFRWRFIAKRAYYMGYSKHFIKNLYPEGVMGEPTLGQEYHHLQQIFTKLFPKIFKGSFRNPVAAWRKFLVTAISVLFTGLGYGIFFIKPFPFEEIKKVYNSDKQIR